MAGRLCCLEHLSPCLFAIQAQHASADLSSASFLPPSLSAPFPAPPHAPAPSDLEVEGTVHAVLLRSKDRGQVLRHPRLRSASKPANLDAKDSIARNGMDTKTSLGGVSSPTGKLRRSEQGGPSDARARDVMQVHQDDTENLVHPKVHANPPSPKRATRTRQPKMGDGNASERTEGRISLCSRSRP